MIRFVLLFLLAILFVASIPLSATAQSLVPCGGPGQPACGLCTLFELVHNIITFLLVPSAFNSGIPLVLVLAGLLFAVGGFFMLTAAGNMNNLARGRVVIFSTVVGLLIVYGSWIVINLVLATFGAATFTGTSTWWQIECRLPTTVNLYAPATLTQGSALTLTWSPFNATSCTASGAWQGDKDPAGGSEPIPSLQVGEHTFTLECTGSTGTATRTAKVSVFPKPAPIVVQQPQQ